jgi:hypothetical protein
MIVDAEVAASIPVRRWKLLEAGYACGDSMAPAPLADFEVTPQTPKHLQVALNGHADGLLIEKPDGTAFVACAPNIEEGPRIGTPEEGWAPGTYKVYLLSGTSPSAHTWEIEVQFSSVAS